ncbi:MAG: transporter substrate-binding domain-containing protein [Verrucomicrobiales bacterium]|nr:transporter substrate-binding domain-containing protein [Verrucomicrobiales bacterium]
MNRLLAAPFLFTLSWLISCSPTDQSSSSTDQAEPLVIGMELAYPPFEMRGADGKPDGISVRMAEDLAAHLKRPLKIEDIAWDGIIPSLQSGKIDLIISSMTRTDERAQAIDFSDPYVSNGLCMLVAKNSPYKNIDDLQESTAKVTVKLATTGHLYAQAELEGVELIVLDEASMCALEVAQGKADAFIYDQISIYRLQQQHPEKTRALLQPIRQEEWAIGIKKGNHSLQQQVNDFLKIYRGEKKFEALAQRYMKKEKQAFEEAGVPFIFH